MTHRILAVLTLALVSPLATCSRPSVNPNVGDWAIYMLRDTTTSVADAATRDLDTLVLEAEPLVTTADITAYSWSKHSLSVTPGLQSRLAALGSKPYKSAGIPFVVAVGDERVYLGAFWYGYSSSYPRVPYIMLPPLGSLKLEILATATAGDPRGDPRLYASLRKAGSLVE